MSGEGHGLRDRVIVFRSESIRHSSCQNSSLGKSSIPVHRYVDYPLTALSGLAWHTDDSALRAKFEEFGQVEEAVITNLFRLLPEP